MRTFILIFLIFISACSRQIEVVEHDYEKLLDTYEKTELEIKRDLQIIVIQEFIRNEQYLPQDLFTVKYSEKQRWMKFLESISKFDFSEKIITERFYLYYDITETGISIDREMYYEVEDCDTSTIYQEQECDGDNVTVILPSTIDVE